MPAPSGPAAAAGTARHAAVVPPAVPAGPATAPVAGPVVLQVQAVRGQQYYGFAEEERIYLKIHLYVSVLLLRPACLAP